jgi:hypothetical protein
MIGSILLAQTKSVKSVLTLSRTITTTRGEMDFERCENRGTIFALFEIEFPLAL